MTLEKRGSEALVKLLETDVAPKLKVLSEKLCTFES